MTHIYATKQFPYLMELKAVLAMWEKERADALSEYRKADEEIQRLECLLTIPCVMKAVAINDNRRMR